MKIILIKDLRGLGRVNDIKNVSDGYARNFLIPRGLAKPATEKGIEKVEFQKLDVKHKVEGAIASLDKINRETTENPLGVLIKTGAGGEIFASLKEIDVLQTLRLKYPEITELNIKIHIAKPIKDIGTHQIDIDAGKGIKNTFMIEVLPDVVG